MIGVLIVLSFSSYSQITPSTSDTAVVYTIVEQMPEFPGGTQELFKYLSSQLVYPYSAIIKRIQGTVFVAFVVGEKGDISAVTLDKGVAPDLDQEAIRVVKSMPLWKPGKQSGKIVSVRYHLPIKFRLTDPVKADKVVQDTTRTSMAVEKIPEFPGGMAELFKFISKNLKQPKGSDLTGRVIVRFIIDSTGATREFNVLKGLSQEHDAEALRVMKLMPNWIPGYQANRAVTVRYSLPVIFKD